ncbi:MAG TPA: maleylpyruvate isomerase N-terminal domain-containing protein [Nitrolancea sp.]|jgi:hypothetical protein|nr:maleylpyruvate isomerase N-terminal domain-containing protein [Nitrolancea sp.]
MTITQQERLSILQEISASWLDLLKAIRALSDAELLKPNTVGQWSGKDLMGHITFWERHALDTIEAEEAGREPDLIDDFETANLIAAKEMANLSLDEIRTRFNDTHNALMQALETTPLLTRDRVEGSTFGHYAEHVDDFRAIKG